jgi:hypothetical protein
MKLDELYAEFYSRPEGARMFEQDRFDTILTSGARLRRRPRTPVEAPWSGDRPHNSSGDAFGNHDRGIVNVRASPSAQIRFHSGNYAQQLHAALPEAVGARMLVRTDPAINHETRNGAPCEQSGRRQSGKSSADDQNGTFSHHRVSP